jgi:hypothetical protein
MFWFILSIFIAFGIMFIGMGYTNLNFLSPSESIYLGALIILVSIWVGYRHHKYGKNITGKFEQLFIYLDTLYNDTGLFVKQYFDSDDSHNGIKGQALHARMEEFVPLMARYKLQLSSELVSEIEAFFDKLFQYKGRVEGAISHKRDETAYKRWLEIHTEFGQNMPPILAKLKSNLIKTHNI